jgi:aflatoxin B1 aldehyde reductase
LAISGGLLAGTLKSKDDLGQPGGRFDVNHGLGKIYRAHYTSGGEFEALALLQEVAVS